MGSKENTRGVIRRAPGSLLCGGAYGLLLPVMTSTKRGVGARAAGTFHGSGPRARRKLRLRKLARIPVGGSSTNSAAIDALAGSLATDSPDDDPKSESIIALKSPELPGARASLTSVRGPSRLSPCIASKPVDGTFQKAGEGVAARAELTRRIEDRGGSGSASAKREGGSGGRAGLGRGPDIERGVIGRGPDIERGVIGRETKTCTLGRTDFDPGRTGRGPDSIGELGIGSDGDLTSARWRGNWAGREGDLVSGCCSDGDLASGCCKDGNLASGRCNEGALPSGRWLDGRGGLDCGGGGDFGGSPCASYQEVDALEMVLVLGERASRNPDRPSSSPRLEYSVRSSSSARREEALRP